MSGLINLNKRLAYRGGDQEGRLINDKLASLKKALLYSYQSATAIFSDKEEFRCLINPDKLKPEYDNKIISIPYKNLNLKNNEEENINIKCGDVFKWKETNSYWIVYLQYLEEDAYFRAEIRRCKESIFINNNEYWIYIRGPVETKIPWRLKNNISWNDINYSLAIYITKNKETLDYFHRFAKVKIQNKNWEVKTVNNFDSDGILEVYLDEDYQNTMEENQVQKNEPKEEKTDLPYIKGKRYTKPYEIEHYEMVNLSGGIWKISNNKARIIKQNDNMVDIEIITGKSGSFNLIYAKENSSEIIHKVIINSL